MRSHVLAAVCFCIVALCAPLAWAAPAVDKEELRQVLRQLLQEEPDLVMDVLKNNSETVLEVAQQGNTVRKRKMLLSQWQQDAKEPKKVDLEARDFRGAANAPVTIVAYSDYTCSFCRQSELVMEVLLKTYKDKVRFVFKPLPKEDIPLSLAAAKYSVAAFLQDPEKGWKLHDMLFDRIEDMESSGDQFIKEAAEKIGLDLKKLRTDASGPRVDGILNKDRTEADDLGVTGTPFFLVNNLVIRGAVSVELFEEAVEMALKLQKK